MNSNMNIEKIWLAYQAALKRFLLSKVSNEADVDDLMQEVLIKSYQNLARLKDQSKVKSWLFQIANHTIIDFYRRKATGKEINADEAWVVAENEQVRNTLADCITPFIDALPEAQAKLLTAIDIENQSQKDYAQAQGISYSTLKSRVQKSRLLLKEVFDDCCHFKMDRQGNVFDFEKKEK